MRLRYTFRTGPVAVAVAMSLALTACQGGDSASSGNGSMMINYASGKTVLQRNFNPLTTTGDASPGTRIYMYQSLMGVNVLKGGEFEPWLASAQKLSSDGKTLTVDVDKKATWSDGKPVTAKDVVFTFQLVKKTPALNSSGVSFVSVAAQGEKTVVFHFDKPAFTQVASILQQYIVPEKYWAGKNPVTYANPDPVGSGPYTLKRFASQQITLGLRGDYWRSRIQVKEVRLPVVNSATEISQLTSGQEDLSGGAIPNLEKQYVDKDPSKNGYFYPTYGSLILVFNHDRGALKDVRLRKAVELAINRQQLIQLVTQLGASPISQTGLDAATQGKWLDPAYKDAVQTDVTAAKSQLEQAGYKLSGGKAMKDGKQLTLNYIEVSDFADSVQRARIIADQLGKIGIKVKVQPLAQATYNDTRQKGDFDLASYGLAYGAVPWQIYNPLLNSQFAGTPSGGKAQTNNYLRWRDKTTDGLLNELANTGDEQTQIELTRKLEKIIVDQVPFVTLSNITAGCAWSARNWTGFPSKDDPYDICAPWNGGPAFENVLAHLKPAKS
ncbi:ABC transporter substrate-binding protein [Streptomyces sp. NPDC046862]|uniref:ABC transporter substrate-binding protein n=1 Tax=Streptomyces sp. NPDC046862 TaxID=3154603 RepID=UPI003455DB73